MRMQNEDISLMIKTVDHNRFEDFFSEDKYNLLKNYLYNYILRKEAVEDVLHNEAIDRALEVGSGISPVMTRTDRIVYTDVSLAAVRSLKNSHRNGWYVVADCTRLPFKQNIFSHAICSEVLEHISDDKTAIQELARTLKPSGQLIVTFPHRKFYFAIDDRLVKHYRRYEIAEMKKKISAAGFIPITTQKVLGPLEKLTMIVVVVFYLFTRKIGSATSKPDTTGAPKDKKPMRLFIALFKWVNKGYAKIVWMDAKIMPRAFSTVVLMKCTLHENPKR